MNGSMVSCCDDSGQNALKSQHHPDNPQIKTAPNSETGTKACLKIHFARGES